MLSASIKGVAPEKFMDRFRQKMAESGSGYGQGEIFDLIYDISEKEPLLPVTFNKILERVDNLTKENPDVLNQKHFKRVFHFSSNTKPTWRSPLYHCQWCHDISTNWLLPHLNIRAHVPTKPHIHYSRLYRHPPLLAQTPRNLP